MELIAIKTVCRDALDAMGAPADDAERIAISVARRWRLTNARRRDNSSRIRRKGGVLPGALPVSAAAAAAATVYLREQDCTARNVPNK